MTVSSFLTNLVIPLNLAITLLVVAALMLLLRLRKLAALVAVCALVWVIFWSLPASTLWAGGRLEQLYPHREPANLPQAQAIVVLGGITAGARHNWFEPIDTSQTVHRIDTAAALYLQHRAPYVIVSGAALEGSVSEAQIMANALQRQGVPSEAIIKEENSYTTYENALYTAELLRKRHIDDIILVTSALHMPRAMAVFREQGIVPIPAPAPAQITVPARTGFSFWQPSLQVLDASRSIIKEYVGMLVYWLRGWT